MPIESAWYFEKRVLYVRFAGEVTAAEVEAFAQKMSVWQAKGTLPVHLITDHRAQAMPAPHVENLHLALRNFVHPDCGSVPGWQLRIGRHALLANMMATVVRQVKNQRQRRFETMGAALAFLQEQDPTLPNLLLNTELS